MIAIDKWEKDTQYSPGKVIEFYGVIFICRIANRNIIPTPVYSTSSSLGLLNSMKLLEKELFGTTDGSHLNLYGNYWVRS